VWLVLVKWFCGDGMESCTVCCWWERKCMSVTEGASVVGSKFVLQQTEHRPITDRAAIMPAG
jgi:hypothetical protein